MKKITGLSSLLFFCLVSYTQTTVTIVSSADNTIYQNPNVNSNALGQNIFSGTNGGGSPRRGLIKFDVSSAIPPGALITGVSFTLNCNVSRSIADDVAMHKLMNSWGEGTSNAGSLGDGGGAAATSNDATWLTRFFPTVPWTNAGGDYLSAASTFTSVLDTGFYTWTGAGLVADVQSWINDPATNFGWVLICNETTTGTARKFGSRENAKIANRPALSVTYTSTVPVILTYFKAVEKNNGVILNWETMQEINNDFFEILHSLDGMRFSSIGKITGHGNSAISNHYQFVHRTTLPGSHFYKLVQQDFNGRQTVSAIEKVILFGEGRLIISLNPVNNIMHLYSRVSLENSKYNIADAAGRILLAGILKSGKIETSTLKSGIYYLRLIDKNGDVKQATFIKL